MDAIAFIAGILGLVWGGVLLLRGGLVSGCLAMFLAGVCFGVPFFKIDCGPVPVTADRLLFVVIGLQYVFWRRFGWADPKPLGKPEILLLIFMAVMIFSTLRADWTSSNYQPLSWLILYYLMPAAVYWILRQTKITERSQLAVLGFFAVLGVYLAFTSIAEYGELWALVFPKYIVTTAADQTSLFVGRARGPLLNPVINGILMTIGLTATLLWWPRFQKPGKLCLLTVALLMTAAIALSLTRSVWMGGVFAMALVVGPVIPRHWRLPLFGGSLLLGLIVAATQWDNLVAFKRDKQLTAEETASSVESRPIMAVIAWNMFLDRPVFGCGYAQYMTEHKNYLDDRSTDYPLERAREFGLHNVAFSLLTEDGLVGFGLFTAILFFWTRDAWRLWRRSDAPLWARQQGLLFLVTVGLYLINGMFHDVSIISMTNMTLFFMAGITASLRPLTLDKPHVG
jgi:O-antigen ligase